MYRRTAGVFRAIRAASLGRSAVQHCVRRTGGFLKKRMTTIYVDSRKRVAGSDSDFEVDLGESLHLQSDAWPTAFCPRIPLLG